MAIRDERRTVLIASGASLSDAVNFGNSRIFALQMPSSWTTANLTFQASHDGVSFANVYDENGSEVSISAAAGRLILVDPGRWLGVRDLKVRSGTAAAPVNQGADRAITLLLNA